jgi:hypothetical protein
VRIWPNTKPPLLSHPLPLIQLFEASRVDSLLGGGAPIYTATAGGVHGARAPSDALPTIVEGCQSRSLVTGFHLVVSSAVSGQIGFLSSHRSCRTKPHRKWCTVARAWAFWNQWHGAMVLCIGRMNLRKETRPQPSTCKSAAEIRSMGHTFTFLIWVVDRRADGPGLINPCTVPLSRHRPGPWDRGPIPRGF